MSSCQIEQHPQWMDGTSSVADESGAPEATTEGGDEAGSDTSLETDLGSEGMLTVLELGPGLLLAIPDGTYDGRLSSMVCIELTAKANGFDSIEAVELQLGTDHLRLGDLVVKIQSPRGQVLTVMNRPGVEEYVDDGSGTPQGGTHVRLAAAFPVIFRDGSSHEAEGMGFGLMPYETVCRDDGLCAFAPSPGSGSGEALSDFLGHSAPGAWRICVGDATPSNEGDLDYVALTLRRTH